MLSLKIEAQSATIEAQNQKLDVQQQTIHNFSLLIVEQKRVMEQLFKKVEQLIGLPKRVKSKTGESPASTTAARVSESNIFEAELEALSQNITVRPHRRRATEGNNKDEV